MLFGVSAKQIHALHLFAWELECIWEAQTQLFELTNLMFLNIVKFLYNPQQLAYHSIGVGDVALI